MIRLFFVCIFMRGDSMKEQTVTIAIIDNEKQTVDQLKNYLQQMYDDQQIILPIIVKTFTSVQKLKKSLKTVKYDLLIMDIWLNTEINGWDLAQQAREINKDTQVIFMSGYMDFLPMSWENGALRVIQKPITYEKFQRAIVRWLNVIRQKFIEVVLNFEGVQTVLYANEIVYIESKGNKELILMNRAGKEYSFKGIIKSIEEQLAPFNFIRCHNSFLVNLQYLVDIKDKNRCGEAILTLQDDNTISVPISMRKRREVIMAYEGMKI